MEEKALAERARARRRGAFAHAHALARKCAAWHPHDRDTEGEYFQLYSRAFAKRIFFEIVERRSYDAYGAANAAIRLAAQA